MAVAVIAAFSLTACGGGSSAPASPAHGSEPGTSAFPVTVTQQLGTVTIDNRPERVVALDFPSADAAIALGVVPVGMYEVSYVDGGVQQWTKQALQGRQPELINTDQGFPFELGFAGVTDTVAGLEGQDGRAKVSAERYALLDTDVIAGTSPDLAALDQLATHEIFTRIPAVARGAFVPLEIGPATAMAFPSVLSVPYALEELVPRLARAAEST